MPPLAGCAACATPGGGCQFLGTAATSQVVAEALGMALPHSALAPSGQPIWLDMARPAPGPCKALADRGLKMRDILTPASIRNAMVVHAACGGSTNLLLHIPAIAFAAGLPRPTVDDWSDVNRRVPRFVSVLPNGPVNHPTVRVFLAGGVPEIMLHLRELGLLDLSVLTVTGQTLGEVLDWWEKSRAAASRSQAACSERDGVDPDDVIIPPAEARRRGLTSTVCFPRGNLCPEGSVIKARRSIRRSSMPTASIARPARRASSPPSATRSPRSRGNRHSRSSRATCSCSSAAGRWARGMEETYQITSALKFLKWGREVAVVTDARFSGVSTGACIGHVGPEALAGGPIGKLRDGDLIQIVIDRNQLIGRVDLVGERAADASRPRKAPQSSPRRSPRPGSRARPGPACRHAALGRPAARRRRHLGRLRLRRGEDRGGAGREGKLARERPNDYARSVKPRVRRKLPRR